MRALIPGVLATAVLALGAWLAGPYVPLAGAPLVALAAGALLGTLRWLPAAWRPGVEFTVKRLLRLAIVLFGTTLSLGEVLATGGGALLLITITVLAALAFTALFGAWLRAPARLTGLIGVGTAICGATAIITIGPVLQSSSEEITFAVTTIFLFNAIAVAVYPVLGHLLGLSDRLFGLWAGTAIHDTSSVLAAAYAYSDPAGQVATVVKLARTLMLVPLALAVAVGVSYRRASAPSRSDGGTVTAGAPVRLTAIFPWFVLWFAAAALLHSVGVLPPALVRGLGVAGKFLVVMVMAAVGLGADAGAMRRLGMRPLLIGLAAAVVIAALSLTLARWLGS
jgi:uncharacterized integral membrane protein (TIGR00698 family)